MQNQHILTPFFLDDRLPGLRTVAKPDWKMIAPTLPQARTSTVERTPAERQERMAVLYRPLRDAVAQAAGQGLRPVSLAGDCCTSLAVFAGLQKAGLNPTLLWLDAHGDFNTWETTPSGFLGGMPLAMMVGRGEQTLPESLDLCPVPEKNIVLSDARDLDPGEHDALQVSAVNVVPDPAALIKEALPRGPLYVHFDSDILDPAEAPAMNYKAPGGPDSDTLRRLFRRLSDSGQVVAVSLSAWNPDLDTTGSTEELVMSLLAELIN